MTCDRRVFDLPHLALSDTHRGVGPAATARPTLKACVDQPLVVAKPNARLLRDEVIKWLSDPKFTHAITLNPNRGDCSLRTAKEFFGRFCKEVDRMMLSKKRVERVPTICRFEAVAFPEHLESNLHLHVVANFARRYWGAHSITEEQEAELGRIWRRVTKGSGTSELKLTRDSGWARYVTKEWFRLGHDYILSSDFHSDRSVVYSIPALDGLIP